MEITDAQRKELLAYLSKRPYSEVYLLVAMLVNLKPKIGRASCRERV